MSKDTERRLKAAAERSQHAKRIFQQQITDLRSDLADRPVQNRIATQAAQEMQEIAGDAIELAKENRGKIALGLIAAAGWVFRDPLLRFGRQLGGKAARNVRIAVDDMREMQAMMRATKSTRENEND